MACATAVPPSELVDARNAYSNAETLGSTTAPVELHAARLALDDAERAFAKEPKATAVIDLAYVAQRRSELTTARAAIFVSNATRDQSKDKLVALGAVAATDLKATRENLSDANAQVSASKRDASNLKTELNESAAKLDVSAAKLTASEANLVDEKLARREAETRLTATLQAMDLLKVKEEPRGLVITLSGAVLFASGQSVLLPAARDALNNVAEALKGTPNRAITVEGHTDSQGTQSSNQSLSDRRAEAVRAYLVSRGINSTMISGAGFGPNRPIAENTTAEGRANNRRVEIVLAPAPPEAR